MEKVCLSIAALYFFGLFANTECAFARHFIMILLNGNTNPFIQTSGLSNPEILLTIQTGQSLRCAGLCLGTSGCTAFYYDASKSVDCQLLKLLNKANFTVGSPTRDNQFYAAVAGTTPKAFTEQCVTKTECQCTFACRIETYRY